MHFLLSLFLNSLYLRPPGSTPELGEQDPSPHRSLLPRVRHPAKGPSWMPVGMSVSALGCSIPYQTEIPPRSKLWGFDRLFSSPLNWCIRISFTTKGKTSIPPVWAIPMENVWGFLILADFRVLEACRPGVGGAQWQQQSVASDFPGVPAPV